MVSICDRTVKGLLEKVRFFAEPGEHLRPSCESWCDMSTIQVSGKDWLPASLWLVLWPPCSGSSTTLSRSTSAYLVPLPLKCQSPWRRSSASQSKALSASIFTYETCETQNCFSAQGSFLYLCTMLLCRAQGCYCPCKFQNKQVRSEDGTVTPGLPRVGHSYLSRNTCLVLSFPVFKNS